MTLEIRKLAHALGAEVRGFDAREPLSSSTVAGLRAAWLEHIVLVFPDQDLTLQQQIDFSRYFGELEVHPQRHFQHPEHPEIFEVTNRIVNGRRSPTAEVGRDWHSDGAFTLRPPTGSLLRCAQLPDVGGDTWFNNMYMAFETLSAEMKRVARSFKVVNDLAMVRGIATRGGDQAGADHLHENPPVVQPMVRVHPETGREALYLNETVTRQIHGMTPEESQGLLQYLFRHSVRPEFTYRHRWRKHDIVMWDNRCGMHLAPADYDRTQVRQMFRTTLRGEPIGALYCETEN
jgi:taurine dioxygenase